jgi:hypothetical protein
MADDFDVIFESDPRDIRYWQAKLDYARGQVRLLSATPEAPPKFPPYRELGETPVRFGKRTRHQVAALFQGYQQTVRKHVQRRRHLKMWLTTKIPYYEARIEALRKSAWTRLAGPDVL